MTNLKKILTASVVTASLFATVTSTAFAAISYPDGGKWNSGYTDPGNGYYMGYSYYDHAYNNHSSSVYIKGVLSKDSGKTLAGYTSIANGASTRSNDITTFYNPNR